MFRVGLNPTCPVCELSFWLELDNVSTQVNCELCSSAFKLTGQLKDRAWSWKSGLFGLENNQEGSIPVALTLQQLDASMNHWSDGSLFLTNMLLQPAGGTAIPKCETDLFVAIQHGDKIQVAIGECKDAGGRIELDDAEKLAAVADAFPKSKFESYIIFSKTAPFTPDEVENCRAAQNKSGALRVIMLSNRELEPCFAYEKTSQEFDLRHSAVSLNNMARVTQDVFFAPRPKKV